MFSLLQQARQRQLNVVHDARPLSFLLLRSGSLLLFLLAAAAALRGCIAGGAALLLVAVPAVLQRQAQRSGRVTLLQLREGRGSLLLCEGQWRLRGACAAAGRGGSG